MNAIEEAEELLKINPTGALFPRHVLESLINQLKAAEKVIDITKSLNITAYDCINFPITLVIGNEKALHEALKYYEELK